MKKLLAAVLSVVILAGAVFTASAIGSDGTAKLAKLGLNYSTSSYTDSANAKGTVHSLVYNPKTSNVLAYVDNGNAGWGFKTLSTATRCEEYTNYNVVAGINNEFFSMDSATYGVLVGYGMYITDGRIAQAQVGAEGNVLAFASDGTINAVKSKLGYTVSVNGAEWKSSGSTALAFINKRSSTWSNGIYIWDSCCGTKTDSVERAPGIEIVCEKLDNAEISVGSTCSAKVVEVRTNSYCSSFEPNQFVMYIKNGSPNQTFAKTIKVGDQVDITVNETVSASKEIMEKANTVTSLLFDAFVKSGKAVTSVISQLPAYDTERPRTGIGFKADGTVVVLVAEGDGINGAAGMNCTDFAKKFIDAGCVTAYNLDGGGSSTVVLDNNGTLEQVYGSGRAVGNSILFVERQGASAIDATIKSALDKAISSVTSEMKKNSAIKTAYDNAVNVKKNTKAMTGDYRAALTALNSAVGGKTKLLNLVADTYKLKYGDYTADAWKGIKNALKEANSVLANSASTSVAINGAYMKLAAAVAKKGEYTLNLAAGKSYTRTKVWSVTPNYDDADFTELTDGDYGSPGYGSCWAGFQSSQLEGGYHIVTLDLGEKYTGINEVSMTFYYDKAAGCTLPTKYTVYTSDTENGTFKAVGTNDAFDIPAGITVLRVGAKLDGASGRYVQIKWNSTGSFSFVSEIEVNMLCNPVLTPVPSSERDLGKNPNESVPEESKEESKPVESKEESIPAESKEESITEESTVSEEVSPVESAAESEESNESASDESAPEESTAASVPTTSEPARQENDLTWLWIALGVIAVGAVTAVIVISARKKK